MRILIVGDSFGFPNGSGATARVRAYCTGLRGCDVTPYVATMVLERPATSAVNVDARGSWRGTEFEYTSGSVQRAGSFLARRVQDFRSLWRIFRLVLFARGERRPDCVIIFSNALRWVLAVRLATWTARVPLILEKSEYPFVYARSTTAWQALYRSLYTRYVFRLFDGAIVISTMLHDYFSQHLRARAPVLRIPILVDAADFPPPSAQGSDYVLFLGTLAHAGEVESLVSAFSTLASTHPNTTLAIAGSGSATDEARILRCAAESGITERIRFLGQVPSDDVPSLVMSARALALPRPSGTFSTAGFPTKLGEYLASGRPVVVTATGDIPLYLTNSVDSLLVRPDDPGAFAEALAVALDDPSAAALGRRGRETALREFNPVTHMRTVVELVESFGVERPKMTDAVGRSDASLRARPSTDDYSGFLADWSELEVRLIDGVPAESTSTVLVGGDVCPSFVSRLEPDVFGSLLPRMRAAQATVVNLECPLSLSQSTPRKSGPRLSASPDWACILKRAGVDAVGLANNHIMDAGDEGLLDTIHACNGAELGVFGGGRTLEEALAPLILQCGSARVAFLAVAEHEFGIAGETSPGAAPMTMEGALASRAHCEGSIGRRRGTGARGLRTLPSA